MSPSAARFVVMKPRTSRYRHESEVLEALMSVGVAMACSRHLGAPSTTCWMRTLLSVRATTASDSIPGRQVHKIHPQGARALRGPAAIHSPTCCSEARQIPRPSWRIPIQQHSQLSTLRRPLCRPGLDRLDAR